MSSADALEQHQARNNYVAAGTERRGRQAQASSSGIHGMREAKKEYGDQGDEAQAEAEPVRKKHVCKAGAFQTQGGVNNEVSAEEGDHRGKRAKHQHEGTFQSSEASIEPTVEAGKETHPPQPAQRPRGNPAGQETHHPQLKPPASANARHPPNVDAATRLEAENRTTHGIIGRLVEESVRQEDEREATAHFFNRPESPNRGAERTYSNYADENAPQGRLPAARSPSPVPGKKEKPSHA